MVHSIEVVFDDATEATVRRIWDDLRDAGIPSQAPASRPHATLAVARHIDAAVEQILPAVIDRLPLPAQLGATLIFGRSADVLARLLLPTADLLELQAEVYRACVPLMTPTPMPHTGPGQWTPHVTLARRVAPARLATALRIAGRPREIAGSVVGLRLWNGDTRTEHPVG